MGSKIVNLGGGKEPISLIDFIGLIEERVGKKAKFDWQPPHAADMVDTSASIEKAQSLLGWSPETGLKEGLDQTVSWYEDNLEWASSVDLV